MCATSQWCSRCSGYEPDRRPTKEAFVLLPMLDKVWDDERPLA
jgi:hypothetical protein